MSILVVLWRISSKQIKIATAIRKISARVSYQKETGTWLNPVSTFYQFVFVFFFFNSFSPCSSLPLPNLKDIFKQSPLCYCLLAYRFLYDTREIMRIPVHFHFNKFPYQLQFRLKGTVILLVNRCQIVKLIFWKG